MLSARSTLALAAMIAALSPYNAFADEKEMYKLMLDNKPDIGVVTKVYLGDRMLEQRNGEYKDCIIPNFEHNGKFIGGWRTNIKSGEPICKLDRDSEKYTPFYINTRNGRFNLTYKVKVSEQSDGTYKFCVWNSGNISCEKDVKESDFKHEPYFIYQDNSFQQTIEYNGKNSNLLKFIYAEFKDGFAREAFTREFQIDLNEGNIAAYKGAIIEIIEADNASITYKVVRNFVPDTRN